MNRPNIVFVLTDDQGYGDLGCHGNPWIRTSNIDGLYRDSLRFTNFHVGPTCAPTRAGLMTGHYANSTGVWHTIGGRSLLRRDEWTLPSALGESGYRTGIFGKWHLGDEYPYRPQDRGFQTSIVHGGGGISQTPDYWGNDYFDDTYMVNGEPQTFTGYCTDVFFGEAIAFIEQNKDEPFLCYIAANAPHVPYNVERRYSDLYMGAVPEARARFYGMITNIDENLGKLDDKLQALGIRDNTILIFMTDNGTGGGCTVDASGYLKEGYNAGLRGVKNSPYDGGHRVPFFMRWPAGGAVGGRDVKELTANIDFMPTLLDLCGVRVPDGRTFHGTSLKPLIAGNGEVAAGDWPERILVTDSQRLMNPVKWRQSAVMTERWRLINGKELYDMDDDREQRNDMANAYPDIVTALRAEYERWWEIVSGQFAEEIPIVIGDGPSEVTLTCHDWRNEDCISPWNQAFIRQGMKASGYWEIEVAGAGRYEVELRRWPKEAGHTLTFGMEGDDIRWRKDVIAEQNWNLYTGGKALPVKQARIKVGEMELEQTVNDDASCASFQVSLPVGPTHLQAWFSDGADYEVGAYYVYIRQVNE